MDATASSPMRGTRCPADPGSIISTQVTVGADPRLAQGGPENGTGAFASELFQEHSKMVLAVCRVMLPDPVEAEDAMQQTFLRAYRSILTGNEPRRPAVWLATIARNECLDRIRARTREPLAEPVTDGTSRTPDALHAAIASEDLRALRRSIRELPTQQRDALVLHEFYGLPYGEVAAAIGVSESAIGSLLFRARKRLRSLLERAHGTLAVPALWDGLTQLARAPAIKVAALPLVAKVGTAAVAVGLTAGAVVAVEHQAEAQPTQPTPPAKVSVSAPPFAAASQIAARTRLAEPSLPASPLAIGRAHRRAARPAKTSHDVHPIPATKPHHPAYQAPQPVSSAPERQSATPYSHAHQGSSRAAANRRSEQGEKVERGHSGGKPGSATPVQRRSNTRSATRRSDKPASPSLPGLGANGTGNGNAFANGHAGGAPSANTSEAPESQPVGQRVGSDAADEHGADKSGGDSSSGKER
jgi:RNA polymerase sigma factor (sigma-70 family)